MNIPAQLRWPLDATRRFRRPLLSALILFHLIVFTLWAFPVDTPLIVNMRNAVRPYILWAGLFQRWNMFAPEPVKVDIYLEAEVTLHDGSKRTYAFPRMEKLSYLSRYAMERHRKYEEYMRQDAYAGLWPDAARHVARLYANAENQPVLVLLARNFSEVEPPQGNGTVRRTPWTRVPFYLYVVKRSDLE